MKTGKIFWGIALILLAVVLLLDAFSVLSPLESMIGHVSLWRVVLGLALLSYVIRSLVKVNIAEIFVPLALIFMLFEENISILCGAVTPNLINNWSLLLIAVLLSIGVGILTSAFKKRIHTKVITESGVTMEKKSAGGSFGRSTVYINSEALIPNYVENNFGACEIYFEAPESYASGGTLHVENNFGAMRIYVPDAWRAVVSVENSFGGIAEPEKIATEAPILYIRGENSFGSMAIIYI